MEELFKGSTPFKRETLLAVPDVGLMKHKTLINLLETFSPGIKFVNGDGNNKPIDGYLVWGKKPDLRGYKFRKNLPIWRCEDAFIRSLEPGAKSPPLGIVIDPIGIYYDASKASKLEHFIRLPLTESKRERAENLINLWKLFGISKYNNEKEVKTPSKPFVLVVDQTVGDISIPLSLADGSAFQLMLNTALDNHPNSTILVKIHPEVASGKKMGHFKENKYCDPRIQFENSGGHPTQLLKECEAVYTVSSQLGFEALMMGKSVYCFGMPFYGGWGLTFDSLPKPARRNKCDLLSIVHAALIDYAVYLDPFTLKACTPENLISILGEHRQNISHDVSSAITIGFVPWKRKLIKNFLPSTNISHFRSMLWNFTMQKPLLRWGLRWEIMTKFWRGRTLQVEDGFLRSVGLGVSGSRPSSWVIDKTGIYFDSRRSSDLELWLSNCQLIKADKLRAQRLCDQIIANNISKYNVGSGQWHRPDNKLKITLVIGQVEKDASIKYGTGDIKTNLELLKAVRNYDPNAYILYKPHPDVVGRHRKSISTKKYSALLYADEVINNLNLPTLLEKVDSVHVLTSLSGFEALIRNKKVYCWGMPFYAGWGLTTDSYKCVRRRRKLELEELAFGALIAYPKYISQLNGWLITPERAIDELASYKNFLDGIR